MTKKAGFVSLGCQKDLVDSEATRQKLKTDRKLAYAKAPVEKKYQTEITGVTPFLQIHCQPAVHVNEMK